MNKNKYINIKDMNGINYKEGDIVLNTCFGDLWLVEKYSKTKVKQCEEECPFLLSQFGIVDNYFMDLDEPSGFKIISTKGDKDYNKFKRLFLKLKIKFYIEQFICKVGRLGQKLVKKFGLNGKEVNKK